MKLTWGEIFAIAIVVLIGGYFLSRSTKEITPQEQDAGGLIVTKNDYRGDGGTHYVEPNGYTGTPVVLPVRYPTFTGPILSAIAHFGLQPLYRHLNQDYDYLVCPPGNESI